MAAAIIAAVVIITITVITTIAITAKLYLRAKSITLLPIIYIPIVKVVGFIVYTNLISLKELLKNYTVNT